MRRAIDLPSKPITIIITVTTIQLKFKSSCRMLQHIFQINAIQHGSTDGTASGRHRRHKYPLIRFRIEFLDRIQARRTVIAANRVNMAVNSDDLMRRPSNRQGHDMINIIRRIVCGILLIPSIMH